MTTIYYSTYLLISGHKGNYILVELIFLEIANFAGNAIQKANSYCIHTKLKRPNIEKIETQIDQFF